VSYQELLTALNSKTLEHRRLSCDLTMHYTIFHNLTPWVPSDYVNDIISPYDLHSVYHDFNMRKPLCRNIIFSNDFLTFTFLYGTVCLVLSLIQCMLLRLSVLLDLLICSYFKTMPNGSKVVFRLIHVPFGSLVPSNSL